MPAASVIRVVVVDDHPTCAAGIRSALSGAAHIALAGEGRSAQETLQLLSELQPPADVLVVEPCLSDGAGLALIRAVTGTQSPSSGADWRAGRPEVLVVSVAVTDVAIFAALRAGAKGYLTKTTSSSELLRAVTVVAEGGAVFSPAVAARLTAFFSAEHADRGRVIFADLTERELEVLDRLARGWNNQQIAKDLVLTEKTVRNYVWRVITKVEVGHRAEAAVLARKAGLGGVER